METFRTIDLWTEHHQNHYECFNGGFVDGFENNKIAFDEYKIVKNCNCIITVNNEEVNIGNKHKELNKCKIEKWTIRNLLTHTTGYESQMMSERFIENINRDNLIDYVLNYDIPYEVGNRSAYNNAEPFISD